MRKNHDPAGLGQVLGLPRAAEVKTIRRKLREIAQRGQAAEWHRRLACRRAQEQPSALATLPRRLREFARVLSTGSTVADAAEMIGVSEDTGYRMRNELAAVLR